MTIVPTSREEDIEFEVLREPWNKYKLEEGAILRSKLVLLKLKKVTEPAGLKLGFKAQTLQEAFHVPDSLKGTPDATVYTPEQLIPFIIRADIPFTTLQEDWNEYVGEDGTKVRIKATIVNVARTSKFNVDGDPIYYSNIANITDARPRIVPKSTGQLPTGT